MSRSLKKPLFVDPRLLAKIVKSKNKNKPLKVWCRASVIPDKAVGYTLLIHNGKSFTNLQITLDHVGFRLGEFVTTRRIGVHGKAGTR